MMIETVKNYWFQLLALVGLVLSGAQPIRLVPRRGAGFLEYALIALVAIIIFVAFRTQITGFISRLWTRIGTDSGI